VKGSNECIGKDRYEVVEMGIEELR